jgi:hypothetical protein
METSLNRLMLETQFDIKSQTRSLDSAFRLTGREHRYVAPVVTSQFTAPVPDNLGDNMPHNAFKYYLTADAPASIVRDHPDQLQYLVILNEAEFRQMNDVLSMMIGENLQQDASDFRRKLYKNYISIIRNNMDLDIPKSEIKRMLLNEYIQKTTGLVIPPNKQLNYKVVDLKRESKMPQAAFEAYINFLIKSRNDIKQQALLQQRFTSNGKTYYYVTQANWKQ